MLFADSPGGTGDRRAGSPALLECLVTTGVSRPRKRDRTEKNHWTPKRSAPSFGSSRCSAASLAQKTWKGPGAGQRCGYAGGYDQRGSQAGDRVWPMVTRRSRLLAAASSGFGGPPSWPPFATCCSGSVSEDPGTRLRRSCQSHLVFLATTSNISRMNCKAILEGQYSPQSHRVGRLRVAPENRTDV